MSKLITLGCSFSQGMGCHNIELYNSYNVSNYSELPPSYYNKIKEFVLTNSIGKHLQDKFGFREYHNYAHSGSSNQSQVLKFFTNLPEGPDNTIVWQITVYDRKPIPHDNVFLDGHLNSSKWVNEYYKDILTRIEGGSQFIDDVERSEAAMYINIIREYCKVKNWNFYIWFWIKGESEKMLKKFPHFKDCIIPYDNPSFDEFESYTDITGDYHPNEFGYKHIADNLIETILTHCKEFPYPNETPTDWYELPNNT